MLPQDQISDIMFIAALHFGHNLVQHMVQVLKHHLQIIVHPLLRVHIHFKKGIVSCYESQFNKN